jgi:hypothetical protein
MMATIYNKPVDMVAYFDAKGNIKPIKFKIQDENGFDVVVKDIQVIRKMKNALYITYGCNIKINNRQFTCELQYDLNTLKWILLFIQ